MIKKLKKLKINQVLLFLLILLSLSFIGCSNQDTSVQSETEAVPCLEEYDYKNGTIKLVTDGKGVYILNGLDRIDVSGELRKALDEKQHQMVLDELEQLSDGMQVRTPEEEIALLNCKGVVLTIMGRYEEAKIVLDELLQEVENSSKDADTKSCIYNNYGTALGTIGYLDIAYEYLKKADHENGSEEDIKSLIITNNLLLAKYFVKNRDVPKFDMNRVKAFMSSMTLYEKQISTLLEKEEKLERRSPMLEAVLYKNKGIIYTNMGQYSEAIDCYNSAWNINRKYLEDALLEGENCSWLGRLEGAFAKYERVGGRAELARKAYKLYDSQYLRIGETYALEAWFKLQQNDYDGAYECLKEALKYGEPSSIVSGFTYSTIPILLDMKGDTENALKWFLRSYKICHEKNYIKEEDMINYIHSSYVSLELGSEEDFEVWLNMQMEEIDLSERQYLD